MRSAPLIGLPGRRKTGAQIEGFPESLWALEIDMYLSDYSRGVLDAGGLPVHLPLDVEPVRFIEHLDGLVLPGGADIDPSRYGRENTASDPDCLRDEIEFALLDGAMEIGLPVLGVCRGLQILNVAFGGTLNQDVPHHQRYDVDPAERIHTAHVTAGSALHDLYGDSVNINSLHHQTIETVGAGLTVVARDDDGTIEGVEVSGRDVLAVQWHPEMMNDVEPVFAWLVERAEKFRTKRGMSSGSQFPD